MKIALAVPGPADPVNGAFAFDLAMLVGHLLTEVPEIDVRIMMASPGHSNGKDRRIEAANAWGADITFALPAAERFPPNALDLVIAQLPEAQKPLIEVVQH